MTQRLVAFTLAFVLVSSCAATRYRMYRRVTGTCDGACQHYLSCKGPETPDAVRACMAECNETFSDPYSLAEFERLNCEDAVAFVEGKTGRGPGAHVAEPE